MFLPSTTVTVQTATVAVDSAGYPDRTWATAATGVPAHFGNRRDLVDTGPVDFADRHRHSHRILLPRGTEIHAGDRLVDAVGRQWIVDHVYLDHDTFGISPVRCDVTTAAEAVL